MSWFDNDNQITITSDLDIHDMILYALVFGLIMALLLCYVIGKCKKLRREIENVRRAV